MAIFNVQRARQNGLSDVQIQQMVRLTGATPSEPLQGNQAAPQATTGEPKRASALDRFKLSFGDAQGREAYLKERGITEENVNKPGFDLGDITSKAGGLLPILGSVGAGVATAPAAVASAPTVVGPLAIESAAMGAGAAAGEATRQGIGKLLGVRQNTSQKESVTDIGKEGVFGLAGPLLNKATIAIGRPIVRHIAKGPVRSFMKALNPSPTLQRSGRFDEKVAEEVMKRGYRGTLDGMKEQAAQVITRDKPIVDTYIQQNADKVIGKVADMLPRLEKLMTRKQLAGAETKALDNFKKRFMKELAKETGQDDQIKLGTADKFRRAMDEELTKAYKSTLSGAELPPETEGRQIVANFFRKIVNDSLPAEQREARSAEHYARLMLEALEQRATKKGVFDYATGGLPLSAVGALAGYGLAGGAGAVAGGALGRTTAAALQSTPVRTGVSSLLRPVTSAARKGARAVPAGVKRGTLTGGTQSLLRLLESR